MVRDPDMLKSLRQEWEAVRSAQGRVQLHLYAAVGGLSFFPHKLADISYSLVLLFACAVLKDVLIQLCNEGNFTSKRNQLGTLMHSSKAAAIPWVNFALVDRAREERNDVAHKQKILPRCECWKFIDAIENELVNWGIVPAPIKFKH